MRKLKKKKNNLKKIKKEIRRKWLRRKNEYGRIVFILFYFIVIN